MIPSLSVVTPKNARGRPLTRLCLALETFRRTEEGRVRDAKAFLGFFFSEHANGPRDRLFLHMPNEVRANLLSSWGIRGKKSALRDDDDKVRVTVSDALAAGDIDAEVVEEGVTPEILIDWIPLSDWWVFWRGASLPISATRQAFSHARDLALFDERWFLENLKLPSRSSGTDVLCSSLSKERLAEWLRAVHMSGDASPVGLVEALGWDTILTKTAPDALLATLDALARHVGLTNAAKTDSLAPHVESLQDPASDATAAGATNAGLEATRIAPSQEGALDNGTLVATEEVRSNASTDAEDEDLPESFDLDISELTSDSQAPDDSAGAASPGPPTIRPSQPQAVPVTAKPSSRPPLATTVRPSQPQPLPAKARPSTPPLPTEQHISPSPVTAALAASSGTYRSSFDSPPPAEIMVPINASYESPVVTRPALTPPPRTSLPSAPQMPGAPMSAPPTARALFGAPSSELPPMRPPATTLAGVGTPPPVHESVATAEVEVPTFVLSPDEPPWAPPRAEPGDMGWDIVHGVKRTMATNVQPRYHFEGDEEPTSEIALLAENPKG